MSRGILTLEAGSRFWFEGEVWEVDTFVGDQVRLRRGVTVRSVSTSALLAAATPLDDTTEDRDQEGDSFALPAVALAAALALLAAAAAAIPPALYAATRDPVRVLRTP